jgi:hypothetical protein
MKRRVSPIAATLAILAAVVIAALAWTYGTAQRPSSRSTRDPFSITIKPRNMKTARENAKKARNKVLEDIKTSSSRETTE